MHETGLEPVRLEKALDFKSNVSANYTTRALKTTEIPSTVLCFLRTFNKYGVSVDI